MTGILAHRGLLLNSGGAAPGPIPTYFGNSTFIGATTASTARSWPVGYAVGDLAIVLQQTSNQAIVTPPTGCTFIASIGTGTPASANATLLAVYYKYATSLSEPAITSYNPGDHQLTGFLVFRGCAASSPIDASSTGTGATTSISLPGLTTTTGNCLVLHIVADGADLSSVNRYSAWTNADLASVTERAEAGTTSGTGGGMGMATGEKAAAGVVGNGSVTFAFASTNYAAVTIAIKPT